MARLGGFVVCKTIEVDFIVFMWGIGPSPALLVGESTVHFMSRALEPLEK